MVKKKNINERLFLDGQRKKDLAFKMKQLLNESNKSLGKPLPGYMAELFLNEIKLSTDEANGHLRDRAKLLGLM